MQINNEVIVAMIERVKELSGKIDDSVLLEDYKICLKIEEKCKRDKDYHRSLSDDFRLIRVNSRLRSLDLEEFEVNIDKGVKW